MSDAYSGRTHDFTIFKILFAGLDFSGRAVHVDSGFAGIKHHIANAIIHLPQKATRNHSLTPEQKNENTAKARVRVVVENAIAKMKAFFVLRIENRMKIKARLNEAVDLCISLANLKTSIRLIDSN